MITDGYSQWYADRLWQLVPAVYRSLDVGPTPGAAGPLRELINRIGAQAAVVRRDIDRLGENQSIETCDDWVIPYIGDLVATRLVSCLDAAAKRADVAKTIYYRRRAGTVGVLEELAADIASREARVVEFFRRMGRTRHQFDPPISYRIENLIDGPAGFTDSSLEVAEGLIGAYSGTPVGGFADLRNVYAASNTGTAFDEFSYTADLRTGGETVGDFNIRHLGVFLWWLRAFPIVAATPVSNGATPPCFTFDPTGRDIPLFAPSQRVAQASSWGEHWVSPDEWELPVAIRETLWKTVPQFLYPNAFSVGLLAGGTSAAQAAAGLSIHPEAGRFSFVDPAPEGVITSSYYFGLLSEIGAGGFDQSILSELAQPGIAAEVKGGSGADIDAALGAVGLNTTIEIGDSLTYAGPTQGLTVAEGSTTVVRAKSGQRPVLRWTGGAAPSWIITGKGGSSGKPTVLILEGLLLQGADVVLKGSFDAVYLRMMTLDPGSAGDPAKGQFFGSAIDGLQLLPTSLFIEASVTKLVIERSITGPIRTRDDGAIEQLMATDSVVQALPTHKVATTGKLTSPKIFDSVSLAASLKYRTNALGKKAVPAPGALHTALEKYKDGTVPSKALVAEMTAAIAQFTPEQAEAAWPLALADLALGSTEGTVSLSRCTVMGRIYAHRLQASECVFDNVATVENPQFGCVRFTTYATGSNLHQPYRCVQVAVQASIFASRSFGQPEYARLRSDADSRILAPGNGGSGCGGLATDGVAAGSILNGAQNGSEMGVYCIEAIALKRRGLAIKFEEYAPIGQLPVWIDVN